MDLVFLVQGSAAEPYRVTFRAHEGGVQMLCTCDAAAIGTHCKHRLRLLQGEATDIVSDNAASVGVLVERLAGTALARALTELVEAETAAEQAKRRVAAAKKALARAMTG